MMRRYFLYCCAAWLLFAGCKPDLVQKETAYSFPGHFTPPDSILLAAQYMGSSATTSNYKDKAVADIFMGLYYGRISAYHQSRIAYNNALSQLKNSTDSLLLGKIYTGLGNASKNLSEYPEALNLFSRALDYYTADSLATAGLHAYIAQVFQLQNDLDQATIHLQYALSMSGSNTNNVPYLLTLHTLANVYGMSHKIDSALALDETGIAIARKIKTLSLESTFLDNKANCFMYSNRPDSARYYFMKSLAIDSASGNKKQVADTWLNLGVLEHMQHNDAKAAQFLLQGIEMANSIGYRNGAMTGWKQLSEMHEKQKNYEAALKAKSYYYSIKDSVLNLKKETATAEWKALYETEKKEEEIRMQSMQLRQKNISIWFVSSSSLLLLGVVYFANRRNKERKEKIYRETLFARDQESAMKILIAEENERKRIAADLHDGVGQSLTAAWLNLQAVHPLLDKLEPEEASLIRTTTQLVGESCAEIRQVSHSMMPNVLFQKGLLPALKEMINGLREHQPLVSLSVNEYEVPLDKTTELILYRIIQECVNNVIRHAKASELYISINVEEDSLSVMIEDNGIGFDYEQVNNQEGIGLQNIRSRVQYLRGSVEWNQVNDDKSGTVVAIYIPLLYDPIS